MGDMAEAFNQKPHRGWECLSCDGSGLEVYEDSNSASGESLRDCPVCGGDGIKPGHPMKDE